MTDRPSFAELERPIDPRLYGVRVMMVGERRSPRLIDDEDDRLVIRPLYPMLAPRLDMPDGLRPARIADRLDDRPENPRTPEPRLMVGRPTARLRLNAERPALDGPMRPAERPIDREIPLDRRPTETRLDRAREAVRCPLKLRETRVECELRRPWA